MQQSDVEQIIANTQNAGQRLAQLPAGTVQCADLIVPDSIDLRGVAGTVLTLPDATHASVVRLAGAGATIAGLTIDGNAAAQAAVGTVLDREGNPQPADAPAVLFIDGNGAVASDLTVRDAVRDAVAVYDTIDVQLDRMVCHTTGRFGIYVGGAKSLIAGSGWGDPARRTAITKGEIHTTGLWYPDPGPGAGIGCGKVEDLLVRDAHIHDTGGDAVAAYVSTSQRIRVETGRFYNNLNHGLHIGGVDAVAIGNLIKDCRLNGVMIGSNWRDNPLPMALGGIAQDNTIHRPGGAGVLFRRVNGMILTNKVIGGRYSLSVEESSAFIAGNVCRTPQIAHLRDLGSDITGSRTNPNNWDYSYRTRPITATV